MASPLNSLYSIINRYNNAKDADRAFTFIEFIKEFGYDNSPSSFLTDYKDYLSEWSKVKKETTDTNKEFIKNSFINILKSIILDYSSYEEQDFLANLNWDNPEYRRAILPFFAEKIKNICDIFKKKRAEAPYIINKHQFKGSRKSLEQIIYNKILDYYFNNKNLNKYIDKLKENLSISIEQYIDIYSDYFDVPRYYNYDVEERNKLMNKYIHNYERSRYLTANINDVDYNYFLNINTVLNDILSPYETSLEELPLTAKMGLDLSGNCAGEATKLRDELLYNATLNQLSLNDQLGIRQRLYKKYLGCDLYYVYVDNVGNVSSNILVKADNPSGNLLNCGNADVAAIENNDIELLSNIGLFFKPDKMGILKVNINNYEWEVDYDKLTHDTVYIFPDPSKYGNIGKNKKSDYPLIMEYKLDSYIRNASSGIAAHEPMGFAGDTYINSYYTKQDDDYRLMDNKNFNYSFSGYLNRGIIKKYATDIFGNEYALLYDFNYNGEFSVPSKYLPIANSQEAESTPYFALNGGYILNPKKQNSSGFDYNSPDDLISNRYIWSGRYISCGFFNKPNSTEPVNKNNWLEDETEREKWEFYSDTKDINLNDSSDKDENGRYFLPQNFGTNVPTIEFRDSLDLNETTDIDYLKSNINESLYFTNGIYEYVDYYNETGYAKTTNTETQDGNKTIIAEPPLTDNSDVSTLKDFKEKSNIIIYKNKSSFNSEIISLKPAELEFDKIKDFFIFVDKLFVIGIVADINKNEKNIIKVYNILDNSINTTEVLSIFEFQNDKFKYLYNESDEKIYTIELIEKDTLFDFIINSYDLNDNLKCENLVNTETDGDSETVANRKLVTPSKEDEFSMTFSYNNNLKKYLLCYAYSNSDKMTLYTHEFKLANKNNFYETLTSNLYSTNG